MAEADRPTLAAGASVQEHAQADARLVKRTLAGDASAFEALFARHHERLYRLAWRYARDVDAALDLAQETFVRAYESLESFRGEGSVGTWLRRILTNLAIDRSRRKSTKTVAFEEELYDQGEQGAGQIRMGAAGTPPPRAAELREFNDALQTAVTQLSDAHRQVFLLHAVEQLSYKEIAEQVGCELGTVMSRLYYARKNLQQQLKAFWDESDD